MIFCLVFRYNSKDYMMVILCFKEQNSVFFLFDKGIKVKCDKKNTEI